MTKSPHGCFDVNGATVDPVQYVCNKVRTVVVSAAVERSKREARDRMRTLRGHWQRVRVDSGNQLASRRGSTEETLGRVTQNKVTGNADTTHNTRSCPILDRDVREFYTAETMRGGPLRLLSLLQFEESEQRVMGGNKPNGRWWVE